MAAFRSILTVFCFAVFIAGACVLSFIIWPCVRLIWREPLRRRHIFSAAVRWSWRVFVGLMQALRLIKVRIVTENGVRTENFRGVIVTANHPSLIDVVILASIVPSPVCVAKVSLARLFFLGPIIENFCITNDAPADEFISNCQKALEAGYNLIIFPEGTRSVPNKKSKFHRGFAYVAMYAGAPIMPVHISVSEQILGSHQKFYAVSDKQVDYTIHFKQVLDMPEDQSGPPAVNARRIVEKLKIAIE